MGCTVECDDGEHATCRLTWCDCGCHHDTIGAHYDGAHLGEPDPFCQVCAEIVGGAEVYYDNPGNAVPPWAKP